MTIPVERNYSIYNTREFLRDLLDPKKTPRIPKAIRRRAYYCLKHYPTELDMEQATENFSKVFDVKNLREPVIK